MAGFGDHDPNDPSGRYYYEGQVNPNDPSVANGQITPEQYAEYQARRRRNAILGVLGVLGGATGLGALGGALGGGAGAAAGSASGSLAPVAGGAPWAITPYAGTAASVPTGAAAVGGSIGAGAAGSGAGTAAGVGGGAAKILGNLSTKDIAALGLAGASTIGGAMSGRNSSGLNTAANDPQMRELMDLMMGRVRKSEPLYDSVLAMANGLLPTQYQKGGGGMG